MTHTPVWRPDQRHKERELQLRAIEREREGDEMRKKRELRRLIEERERIEKIKKQIQ